MDIFKLGLDFPIDSEFYFIDTKKSMNITFNERLTKQEKGFILDCTNLNRSKLNHYNPLFDTNLSSFFSSQIVRKHLNEQGFINTKGFLLLDNKSKKNVLLVDKSPEKFINKNKNIMLAIKENSTKVNIETIEKQLKYKSKILNDPSISQLEKLAHTLSLSPLKNKQLPSYNESGFYFKSMGKTRLAPLKMNKTSNPAFVKSEFNNKDYQSNISKFIFFFIL